MFDFFIKVPTASTQIEGEAVLNQCRFHKKGFHLAVGGDDGRVRLFELHEVWPFHLVNSLN